MQRPSSLEPATSESVFLAPAVPDSSTMPVTVTRLKTGAVAEGTTANREKGVTLRVVLISLLLAVLFGYIGPIIEHVLFSTSLGGSQLPAGSVAVMLILLLVINPLLGQMSRRFALSRNEVLTIYITSLFSSLVSGRGTENFFVPNLLAPFYYATRENKWLHYLQPYLKPWFTPALTSSGEQNRGLVEGWYTGLGAGEHIPWGAWLIPLAAWCALVLAMHCMLSCLAIMLRAQWADREAMVFPLLRLPLELTENMDAPSQRGHLSSFFRDPVMWVGFGLAVFVETVNGLNVYYSEVPNIPLTLDIRPALSEAPWNQLGGFDLRIWLLALAVTFVVAREVSFSLWFFFLFTKVQLLTAYYAGFPPATMRNQVWTGSSVQSFIAFQQFGSYFMYVALTFWIGREHFGHVIRRAFGCAQATPLERTEALPYPVAFWGFVASFTFAVLWTIAAGVSIPVALLLWSTYIVITLALTRVVTESGFLLASPGWIPIGPWAYLFGAGPGTLLNAASIAPATIISGSLMYETRSFLMPSFVQSFKLAHDHKIAMKPLFFLIAAVAAISFCISVISVIHIGYTRGGLQMHPWWAQHGAVRAAIYTRTMAKGIDTSLAANWFWFGVGMATTYAVVAARSRFIWFPLHPIGTVTAFLFSKVWVSIFLGWLLKSLIMRFGGSQSYQRLVPCALGVILGSVAMMIVWLVIDYLTGRTGHLLVPN